jgi:hypothetical protein
LVHSDGRGLVASGGNLIVYPGGDGPHASDLWAVTRSGAEWTGPALLTGDSAYEYNAQPAISADGSTVVFECGDEPYGAAGTAICEVGTDSAGFREVLTPDWGPGGSAQNALRHPDYAPDGSLVFEADWTGQQIWRLTDEGSEPVRVGPAFANDNSPCVLPDGRVVSLWLGRPDGGGLYEIKAMPLGGQSSYEMILTGVDVFNIGIGCGG